MNLISIKHPRHVSLLADQSKIFITKKKQKDQESSWNRSYPLDKKDIGWNENFNNETIFTNRKTEYCFNAYDLHLDQHANSTLNEQRNDSTDTTHFHITLILVISMKMVILIFLLLIMVLIMSKFFYRLVDICTYV
jgi:hypothetical protein